MGFTYLSNLPLDEARALYLAQLENAGFAPRTETVPAAQARGRVTARAVYARISAPHYHACAMDGIALPARATFGATATTPVTVPPGAYTVVDTGDPLPDGCDAVVMVEDVLFPPDASEQDRRTGAVPVALHVAVAPWDNVRQIGEDVCAGEMLLTSRVAITPAATGALLAAGVGAVEVLARPVVGIIPTGDEVVPPSDHPAHGEVMEFNSAIFSGMVEQWGGVPRTFPIVKDDRDQIRRALEEALSTCDIVLLNAGSSAGRDDCAADAIAACGEVVCHGIAIKPGKPAVLGRAGAKAVVGIPGYPVSGIVVMEQIVRPLLERLGGILPEEDPHADAVLARRVISSLKHEEYVRVRVGNVGGRLVAAPLARGAGVVTSFVQADGILTVPQNSEGLEAGEVASVRLLRPRSVLDRTLVVTGSHDPLIDELAELVHAADPSLSVASTHVGSMGAIVAAKRGEHYCGGIHLLDEATGAYNEPYLEKHFPHGGVRQVECVYRAQGLMVAPGNPLGIRGFSDLAREGVRFVNRQKGSGTRILADHLCAVEGVDPARIYGYDHEEFTHTAVAALVEAGAADAGMGIFSAAALYGLDFLHVCEEQYDLLVPDYAWGTPLVEALLAALRSDAFRMRLEQMGGYRLENPGRVRRHFAAT